MKKSSLLIVLFLALWSCNVSAQDNLKRYTVKSGIVHYTITSSGKIMGSTISGNGTESLFFKEWGAVELNTEESSQTNEIKIFGKKNTKTTSKHTMVKTENGQQYLVDFDQSKITLSRNVAMDLMNQTHSNANEMGKNMLEEMGGQQIGNETILGYNCEVWEVMGTKQWIYKGVSLKTEANAMGIKTIKEASSAKFNIAVADSYFALPDFPIQQVEGYMNNETYESEMEELDKGMEQMQNLSYEEWKKMVFEGDPEMKNTSEEELRQSYDMMQKMLKMRKGK